jgi:hypothetical protein
MKTIATILSSWRLTCGLLAALLVMALAHVKITRDWHSFFAAGDRIYAGDEQAKAIANAIEQYCLDFPDAGVLENTRQWTQRLAGQNPKGIRYLKVQKYSQDAAGRLLDLCGEPWTIKIPGSPGFQQVITPQSPDEFQIRSAGCFGFASGHRNHPRFPRS